jgi:methyl-accepting chemotaxis protein
MLLKRSVVATKSPDYFSAIVESQAVIAFDREGTIMFANQVMADTMGYTPEELVGRHHSIFVDAAYARTADYETFWQTLRAGTPVTGEFQRRARSGAAITLGAMYSPIRDRNGRVTGIVKTAAVVTDSRAARQRADHLLRTLDELPVPVMTCDPTTFVIDYMNRASLETLRKIEVYLPIKADAVLGSPIDVFHKRPEHQRRMVGAMGSAGLQTTIKVGDEHLELKISSIGGRPVLVWYVVSHRVAMAESVAQSVTTMERVGNDVTSASDALARSAAETFALAEELDASSRRQATAATSLSNQSIV